MMTMRQKGRKKNEESNGHKGEKVEGKEKARKPTGTEMANERHLTRQPQLQTWSSITRIFFGAQMWLWVPPNTAL